MIIVQAQMWPHGNEAQSYEILNATITNTSSPGAPTQSYQAHVMARPKLDVGIVGYEADVSVPSHESHHGFAPLLMSILAGAHQEDAQAGLFVPGCVTLTRVVLREMREFELRLRGK